LCTTVQRENESVADYTSRFKVAKDIMESHLGEPIGMKKVVEQLDDYDKNDPSKIKEQRKEAAEMLYALIHLENADQAKYGQVLKNLNYQQSLGNNEYPKDITATTTVLSRHPYDTKKKPDDKNTYKHNERNKNDKDEPVMLFFAQLEGRCWCCGKINHKSDKCRMREKIPKPEWAINKMKDENNNQSHAQLAEMSTSQQLTTTNNNGENRVGWASVQVHDYSFTQGSSMREWVLLDSDSTHTIFCNPKYVSDIVDVDETLNLGTNGGVLVSNQKCNVAGLGQRWFNSRAIANVISLADMVKFNRVTYDSQRELAFLVHTCGKVIRFPQLKSGLYARNPKTSDKPTNEEAVQFFELSDSLFKEY